MSDPAYFRHRPALGLCASAFASCFPIAFLEPEFNTNNKYSVLAKFQDQSVQAQGKDTSYEWLLFDQTCIL